MQRIAYEEPTIPSPHDEGPLDGSFKEDSEDDRDATRRLGAVEDIEAAEEAERKRKEEEIAAVRQRRAE